jgi:hypothetical protein
VARRCSMSEPAIAQFTAQGDGAPTGALKAHLNPPSLKRAVIKTMSDEQQAGTRGLQSVRQSATKLEVDLAFDTTETCADVRTNTGKLKTIGRPSGTKKPLLPQVTYTGGVFSFKAVNKPQKKRSSSSPRRVCRCAPPCRFR